MLSCPPKPKLFLVHAICFGKQETTWKADGGTLGAGVVPSLPFFLLAVVVRPGRGREKKEGATLRPVFQPALGRLSTPGTKVGEGAIVSGSPLLLSRTPGQRELPVLLRLSHS